MERVVVILLTISILPLVNSKNDYYFISFPNKLMVDTSHSIYVHTTQNLSIRILCSLPNYNLQEVSSIYVIPAGFKAIQYTVPFVGPLVSNIQLQIFGDNCSRIADCEKLKQVKGTYINVTRSFNVLKNNFIIFGETDKPLYKAGERVRLRFMPLYSTTLKYGPESIGRQWKVISSEKGFEKVLKMNSSQESRFDKIIILNAEGVRLAQWLNVSLIKAMNLSFQISKDPVYGKWTAKASFQSQEEIITFTVKRYVLPRFVVDIKPPTEILVIDKLIKFSVCSKYSTGKKMKAKVYGKFCIMKSNKPFFCQAFTGFLNGTQSCLDKSISTNGSNINSTELRYGQTTSVVNVTVVENGTTSEVSKSATGSEVLRQRYNIIYLGKDYYKAGLPYFGKLRLVRPNKRPMKRANVSIIIERSTYVENWGYSKVYTSDKQGFVNFVIPYIPVDRSITVIIKGIEENPMLGSANFYKTLKQWESRERKYLQIMQPTNITCPGTINLEIITNGIVSEETMYVQVFSRGEIQWMQSFPPVPVKCLSRNDSLGHYKCVGGNDIECLPGWQGDNCRVAVCDKCSNGVCIDPNKCLCKNGWAGENCDKCIPAGYCKNGFCLRGNDCICHDGWTGYKCDKKGPKIHQYVKHHTTVAPKTTPSFVRKRQSISIFERILDVSLDKNIGPDAHFVVYFISSQNEVIADSVEVMKGLSNCSHLGGGMFKFSKSTVRPGEKINLSLNPNSFNKSCALKISDTALTQFDESMAVGLDYLINRLIKLNHRITVAESANPMNECMTNHRYKRRIYPGINVGFDSKKAFAVAGIKPVTNTRIINALCQFYVLARQPSYNSDGRMPMGRSRPIPGPPGNAAPSKAAVKETKILKAKLRDFFPETWTFDYYHQTPSVINLTVPDSMTTWKADSYCMTEKGIWISPSRQLQVLLPFFADVYVPYSVKMDETLQLPVKIFNYADECFEIRAKIIVNPKEIKVTGANSATLCSCKNEEKLLYFSIQPLTIGKLNITISATSTYSSFCSSRNGSADISMSDIIRRQLLVEPPGVPTETTFSELICNDKEELGMKSLFHIPSEIVPRSLRTYLVFNGDAMGQTFDNLDQLVKMPYGCGEQNMMTLVPSIYVCDYLSSLSINNPSLKQRAKNYILDGFKRQLDYRHDDGSFSAFGKTDKFGSTWLTAFVVRAFSDASKYVEIDSVVIKQAVQYLGKVQSKDGCFMEKGKLLSSTMAGGMKKDGETDPYLLTAYILISVRNVKLSKSDLDISKAITCVKKGFNENSSNYRLALIGYALSLYESDSKETMPTVEWLQARSTKIDRYQYWQSGLEKNNKINSADVETTGYAFLAVQNYQTPSESLSIIYWLSNQRNSLGGYYSTQDTIVALSALATFAKKIGMNQLIKLNVSVLLDDDIRHTDMITSDSKLLTRKLDLGSRNITHISIKTSGSGCLSIQLISLYNIFKLFTANDTFKLRVSVSPVQNQCQLRRIEVCSTYLRRDVNSNMILITTDLPSGWEVTSTERENIIRQIVTPLNRIDFMKNKIHVYYDGFQYADAGKERCFSFKLEQITRVDNLKDAIVRITDYYKPEIYTDASYAIKDTCKNDTKPKPSVVITCPSYLKDDENSVDKLITMICPFSSSGLIARGNGTKNRLYYQPQYSLFYEWNVNVEPTNCSCFATKEFNTNDTFVLSSSWIPVDEKLPLNNNSVLFPIQSLYKAYQTDLKEFCSQSNSVFLMMNRIKPDFSNATANNVSCPQFILSSTFYYSIKNVTSFLCGNYSSWKLKVDTISNTSIFGSLEWKSNDTAKAVKVDVELQVSNCVCRRFLKDLKRQFYVLDYGNVIYKIQSTTTKRPVKILLNETFKIVERSVFGYKEHYKCKR